MCFVILRCRYFRSVAYRQYIRLVYGYLGKRRIPLPACANYAIRMQFPDTFQVALIGVGLQYSRWVGGGGYEVYIYSTCTIYIGRGGLIMYEVF